MDEKKQIEGMANEIFEHFNCRVREEEAERIAEHLVVNANYRKQSEGEWGLVVDYGEGKKVECSVCEKQFFFMKKGQLNIDLMPYCPKCGAHMRGNKE